MRVSLTLILLQRRRRGLHQSSLMKAALLVAGRRDSASSPVEHEVVGDDARDLDGLSREKRRRKSPSEGRLLRGLQQKRVAARRLRADDMTLLIYHDLH